MKQTSHWRCRGFTLTELAVVMVIVAVLMGGLLIPLSAQRDAQAFRETQAQLDEIREALIGFAVVNVPQMYPHRLGNVDGVKGDPQRAAQQLGI